MYDVTIANVGDRVRVTGGVEEYAGSIKVGDLLTFEGNRVWRHPSGTGWILAGSRVLVAPLYANAHNPNRQEVDVRAAVHVDGSALIPVPATMQKAPSPPPRREQSPDGKTWAPFPESTVPAKDTRFVRMFGKLAGVRTADGNYHVAADAQFDRWRRLAELEAEEDAPIKMPLDYREPSMHTALSETGAGIKDTVRTVPRAMERVHAVALDAVPSVTDVDCMGVDV